MNYLVIADIWEADVHVDVETFIKGGVDGLIVRLNDMNGGHHKDVLFDLNWERAKQFPLQAAYFVYNPWVSGEQNFNWLYGNLPSDYGARRIFSDIEVRYPGYSKLNYGTEVRKFKSLLRNLNSNYTGAGYLDLLDKWPNDSYWWARYPYIVAPANGLTLSWEELQVLLDSMPWDNSDPYDLCPGIVDLWQCTDRVVLPGMLGRAIDISIRPGTLEQAKTFFNIPKQEVPLLYNTYAKGIFLYESCSITDASLLKGHIDFVVGEVGVGVNPKPKFKDWAELAKTLDVPFIGFVGSDPEPYLEMTYNENMWGDAAHDITCNMIDKERHYVSGLIVPIHAWIIDASKYLMSNGKPLADTWMSGIWKHLLQRIFERFKTPTYPFIKKETLNLMTAANLPIDHLTTTLSNFATVSTYSGSKNHIATGWASQFIPSDIEGPLQPYSGGWDFWWYGATTLPGISGGVPLFMYRGTPEDLWEDVGFVPGNSNPEPEPEPEPGEVWDNATLTAKLKELLAWQTRVRS